MITFNFFFHFETFGNKIFEINKNQKEKEEKNLDKFNI